MLVYLIIATVAIGAVAGAQHVECSDCALPAVLSRHQAAHALWVIAFFVLFVPAALRYDIGVDYSAAMEENGYLGYKQLFEMYAHAPVPADGDVGFYALIKLVGLFSDNAQWLFVLLSALVYGLTLRALRRLSAAPVLSVALFLAAGFYFESYSIQKQWVAIACALNALEWVGDASSIRAVSCGFLRGHCFACALLCAAPPSRLPRSLPLRLWARACSSPLRPGRDLASISTR